MAKRKTNSLWDEIKDLRPPRPGNWFTRLTPEQQAELLDMREKWRERRAEGEPTPSMNQIAQKIRERLGVNVHRCTLRPWMVEDNG